MKVNRSPFFQRSMIKAGLSVIACLFFLKPSVFAQRTDTLLVSGNYQDKSVFHILNDLEKKYKVPFYYKKKWLPDQPVSVSFSEIILPHAVNLVLKDSDLAFVIFNDQSIIIAPKSTVNKEFTQEYYLMKERQKEFYRPENLPPNVRIINLGKNENQVLEVETEIRGTVKDALENDPLGGATVFVKDLDMAVTSDANGNFNIKIPGGLHFFEINMLGFETTTVGVNLLGSADWDILMLPEATELDEVLVSGTADNNNVVSTMMGMTKLSPIMIKELPVFLGEPDVIKSILTLPGVSTIGEGATGFNVRGGNIDQNLILQDEAMIFNSSHAMGFFSVFNPDVIKEVTLYKGHIPAQYGGRVSSVLDVQLRGNDYKNTEISGGVGLLASRIALEAPIIKDKTSLLLGGRIAYSDWILNFASNPSVKNSSMTFYDINARISQKLGKKGTVSLSAYNSDDQFTYSDEFGFSWNMNNVSLKWNQVLKPEAISELTFAFSDISNTSFQPSGTNGFILGNGMQNFKMKEDVLLTNWSQNVINIGFEVNAYVPYDETLDPFNEKSSVIPYTGIKDRGLESAVYINDDFKLTDRMSLSLGLRYTYYSQYGPAAVNQYADGMPSNPDDIIETKIYDTNEKVITYPNWNPRASLVYTLDGSSSLKFSYNKINQYIHLISNTTSALPIDYWQVSNTFFKPLSSDNYSVGYFKNFQLNKWETSLEGYYRDLDNVIEYRDFPELFLNDHLETELTAGKGKAYGIELFIKKKTGKFTGWLSYTYARSFVQIPEDGRGERINQGAWFPSKTDQPHSLSMVGNLNLDKSNLFSFNFTFASGRPLTAPDANYYLSGAVVPNFSERNEYRLPDYYRLDVSYTLRRGLLRTVKYKDSFTLSIYNLLARRNAYSVYFKRVRGTTFDAYKLSILGTLLPSVTYNFDF